MNITKFLRPAFLAEHLRWQLLCWVLLEARDFKFQRRFPIKEWKISLSEKNDLPAVNISLQINPLSANYTKWSNTLKQFVAKLPTNCLRIFDQFVGLALIELIRFSNKQHRFSRETKTFPHKKYRFSCSHEPLKDNICLQWVVNELSHDRTNLKSADDLFLKRNRT